MVKPLRLCTFTVNFLLLSSFLFAQKDTIAIRYSKSISAANLSKNLHVLASDEYEGRETGEKGQKMAAEYIASQFKVSGVPSYKKETYYQQFPLNVILPVPAEVSVKGKKYLANKDYYTFPGHNQQRQEINTVQFLGYGIEEEIYDDYEGIDVKDKIIMVLAGEPYKDSVSLISGEKKPSLWTTYSRLKTEKAREKGAKLLLVVVEEVENDVKKNRHRLESSTMELENGKAKMPVVFISRQLAEAILKEQTIEKIKYAISSGAKPFRFQTETEAVVEFKNKIQKINSENVLGYIEGTDKKEELIVITAHYDHLGKEDTVIYNGADDDGSGTVAVIELAQAFAKAKQNGHGPRRSILFMAVAGEEKGLLGSSYYVEHPAFPLQSTICNLNIDMIGRLDEKHKDNSNYVYLIGSDKLSRDLHNISENANATYANLELDYTYNDEKDKNRFYYRSDHYNFVKKGIPVIFYFNGVHADYHKESDEVEKINFEKIEKITRLVFFTAWELANREERIAVDSNKK